MDANDLEGRIDTARRDASLMNLDLTPEERMLAAIAAGQHLRAMAALGEHPKPVEDLIRIMMQQAPSGPGHNEYLVKVARAVEKAAVDAYAATGAAA